MCEREFDPNDRVGRAMRASLLLERKNPLIGGAADQEDEPECDPGDCKQKDKRRARHMPRF